MGAWNGGAAPRVDTIMPTRNGNDKGFAVISESEAMEKTVSRSKLLGKLLGKSVHRRTAGILAGAAVLALTLPVAALAQNATRSSGNRHFTSAPVPKADEAAEADMILGIPANTIFFVAVVAIGIFWFTLGGGRKAKLERLQ